jgi:exosortase
MTMLLEQDKPVQRQETSPRRRWAGILQWSLLAGALFYLYIPVLTALVADWWDDPDYSHGFVVPLLSAYFGWKRRQQLAETALQPRWWGCGVLLCGLSMLVLGTVGAELFVMRSSLVVVIAGVVWFRLGWQHLKLLAFPIAFLQFMIPLPEILLNTIAFPLQLLAAKLSTASLQMIGLPVFRDGNIISLPHITLEIVEACSGLRSLVSLLALAVVFAYLSHRQIWKRVTLVVSAIPIALVANAFRIWGTGVLAHHYGSQVAEGFYHTFAGWLVFVVAFALMGVVGAVLSRLNVTQVDRSRR